MPADIVKQLSGRVPAVFTPIPASGAAKIFPVASEKRLSYDRTYAITIDGTPLAITAVSEGGKAVEMLVPAGLHTDGFAKRWFKTEDVFGKVKWKLEPRTLEVPCLAYVNGGKAGPELIAKIPKDVMCASLGTVIVGKTKWTLAQVRQECRGAGEDCAFMVALVRENPPVATQADYDARAKQLMAEHAFREGRPWGKMFPSLLGNTGCFLSGERYEKADDIRSGDVIRKDHHFFAVIYRHGSQLVTIEGNMNESVSQSSTRYSVKDGKLWFGGKDAGFEYGYHKWSPADRKDGK